MMLALDEGYEGFGWRVFESGRTLGTELKASLAKSLLDYFNDPTVPTSGDELTFFMTKEIMNRLAPSLLVVNFWDIDIAHYGAYSLYLEAIRRTDRLVSRAVAARAVAAAVSRSHDAAGGARAGAGQRRRRERVREPPQRRRVLPPGLARGARRGRAERAPARSARSGRPTWPRRWRAFSGFKMPECEGRPLASWRSERRDAVRRRIDRTTRRRWRGTHGDAAARLPATVHAFILVELQKWPALFPAEQRYQRALLEHLSQAAAPASCGRRRRASRGSSARRRCDRIDARDPGALPGRGAGAAAKRRAPARPGGRKSIGFFQTVDPALEARLYPPDAPRRLVVQLYGSGIAVQPDKLWSRFKGGGHRGCR